MKVYISGAITGTTDYLDRFKKAEIELSAKYDVINPAAVCSLLPNDLTHDEYMEVCYSLLNLADFIYVIPDESSAESEGVKEEVQYALASGITVVCANTEIIRRLL